MQLQYYGLIRQSTGEDWKEAKLWLSTAKPSVGGDIPTLNTLHVGFHRPPPYAGPHFILPTFWKFRHISQHSELGISSF